MKFDDLTPEEIDALLEGLQARKAQMGEMGGGGDNQAEENMQFKAIADELQALKDKVAQLDECMEALADLIQNDLIDKVREGFEANQRADGIKGISEKYGDKFGEYKDFYGQLTGGADIFERLYDELQEARNGVPEWGEEQEGSKVEELLSQLASRRDGVKGALGEAPKAVEVTKVAAAPAEDAGALIDEIKALKKRGIPGMPK